VGGVNKKYLSAFSSFNCNYLHNKTNMFELLSILTSNLAPILGFINSGLGGILGLIHLILWIIAAIEIMKSGKSTGNKLLWILVILFLPVVGLILYYLIGK